MNNLKLIKYIYQFLYLFFYNKLGSDKYTSSSASISLTVLFLIVITLSLINTLTIYLLKLDVIKLINEWLLLVVVILLYLFYRFLVLKNIK